MGVSGWAACPWYQRALKVVENLRAENKDIHLVKKEMVRGTFGEWVRGHKHTGNHKSSPAVFIDDGSGAEPESNFIGGHDAFVKFAQSKPVANWFDKTK